MFPRSKRPSRVGALLVAASIACAPGVASAASSAPPRDLGTLPGGHFSDAQAVNNGGEVVGSSENGSNEHAFSWTPAGGMVDLGTLPGGSFSLALGVNDGGVVVGYGDRRDGAVHAFSFTRPGGMVDLGTLPGGGYSKALGVNEAGEVVGYSEDGSGRVHAFTWTPSGGMVPLGTLSGCDGMTPPGCGTSLAFGVNDSGEVVGYRGRTDSQLHAFSYTPSGGMVDLGTLPGGSGSFAFGVNDSGEVVGYSDAARGQIHAFSFTPARGMFDLGTLPAGGYSIASGVNADGQIVGQADNGAGERGFLWTASDGMTELGTLPRGSVSQGNGINDSGEVVGFSDDSGGNQRAVVWREGAGDPAIAASPASPGFAEGLRSNAVMATFTDSDAAASPSEYSARIDWGDGRSSAGTVTGSGGSFTVTGTHTYAEEGAEPVAVKISDTENPSNAAVVSESAAVADAALSVRELPRVVSPPSYSGAVASFIDADRLTSGTSDFSATIAWGDGQSSTGTVIGSAGAYTVFGSHPYSRTGPFTIRAQILDDGGATAEAQTGLLIYGQSAGGNFVIGDQSAGSSSGVTFWGAHWSSANSLTAGGAPAAFKGFAQSPSALPACGTGWSAGPGNSANPPHGPLPMYMAVILASRASKSGSAITGDTEHEVVVRTRAGYAPDPSHSGTGTVVARIC